MAGSFKVLEGPALAVAPRLLGCYLVREVGGKRLVGKIVESEAYDQTDPASHTYRGKTARNGTMFGPSGHLYVYFTYGMHYCCNVVCGPAGFGSGALIRAVEPVEGEDIMRANRRGIVGPNITNGPGKVCQALAIDRTFDGHDLRLPPIQLIINQPLPPEDIVQTMRIGIKHAVETPWRFYERNSLFVSH